VQAAAGAVLVTTLVTTFAAAQTPAGKAPGAPADKSRGAPPAAPLLAPADGVSAAARDIQSVQPSERPFHRYLSLYNVPPEQRVKCWLLVAHHLNDLSRKPFEGQLYFVPDLGPPTPANPRGESSFSLVRFDCREFAADPKVFLKLWEKLGTFDTYYHDKVKAVDRAVTVSESELETVYVPAEAKLERTTTNGGRTHWVRPKGSTDEDDWLWEKGSFKGETKDGLTEGERKKLGLLVPVKRPKRTAAEGPDVDKAPAAEKLALAGHLSYDVNPAAAKAKAAALGEMLVAMSTTEIPCQTPILRADWFFRMTAVQDGEKFGGKAPGYYDFLGLKTQADFEEAVGVDIKRARTTYPEESWCVVNRSAVALNNRRLMRIGRGWWTMDAKENVGKRNYSKVLDTDTKAETFKADIGVGSDDPAVNEFDATEAFGFLPNRHMAWWLANNKKVRQNFAPPEIASDSTAAGTDRRVHINLSCKRCHTEGVQPVKDVIRGRIGPDGGRPLLLKTPDFAAYERARQLYSSDFDTLVGQDQKVYVDAILKGTGLTARQFADAYADFWNRYQETDFDVDRAVLETGVPRQKLLGTLERLAKPPEEGGVGAVDPDLSGLLKALTTDQREDAIRSEKWEEVFPLLMVHLTTGGVPAAEHKAEKEK
jgi:hypothetical protein